MFFLKMGFENKFTKEVLYGTVLKYGKFRKEQFEDFWRLVHENTTEDYKNSTITHVFTKKATDIPLVDEFDETPKLFLIDDCAGKNEYKDLINRLVLDGRSKNCQVILLAQDFKQIEPTIRRQASCISAFKTSEDSFDKLYKDMVKENQISKNLWLMLNVPGAKSITIFTVNKIDEKLTNNIFL